MQCRKQKQSKGGGQHTRTHAHAHNRGVQSTKTPSCGLFPVKDSSLGECGDGLNEMLAVPLAHLVVGVWWEEEAGLCRENENASDADGEELTHRVEVGGRNDANNKKKRGKRR